MQPTDLGDNPTNVWALMVKSEHDGVETITTGMTTVNGTLVKNVTLVREYDGSGLYRTARTVGSSESMVFILGVRLKKTAQLGFYEITSL